MQRLTTKACWVLSCPENDINALSTNFIFLGKLIKRNNKVAIDYFKTVEFNHAQKKIANINHLINSQSTFYAIYNKLIEINSSFAVNAQQENSSVQAQLIGENTQNNTSQIPKETPVQTTQITPNHENQQPRDNNKITSSKSSLPIMLGFSIIILCTLALLSKFAFPFILST